MKFGKVRIENGSFLFNRHMVLNSLPCKDILWAYKKQEAPVMPAAGRHLLSTYLVIITKRRKIYQFDMTLEDADRCIELLKALTPEMTIGFPRGDRIRQQGLSNTRDLGALMTSDKKYIIPRKLLRSGDLYHLSMEDQRTLEEDYNLKKVIDLRSNAEREERPDTMIAGVEYYHIPILDEEVAGEVKLSSIASSLYSSEINTPDRMKKLYLSMIEDKYAVNQFARFMDVVIGNTGGAVLWHGGVGKDRTGLATALLLTVLTVPDYTIISDFVRSNEFLANDKKYLKQYMEGIGAAEEQIDQRLEAIYNVKGSYLNYAFEAIYRNYGSIDNFVKRGLLLTSRSIELLREQYVL